MTELDSEIEPYITSKIVGVPTTNNFIYTNRIRVIN
jgi:hypothetical protein